MISIIITKTRVLTDYQFWLGFVVEGFELIFDIFALYSLEHVNEGYMK